MDVYVAKYSVVSELTYAKMHLTGTVGIYANPMDAVKESLKRVIDIVQDDADLCTTVEDYNWMSDDNDGGEWHMYRKYLTGTIDALVSIVKTPVIGCVDNSGEMYRTICERRFEDQNKGKTHTIIESFNRAECPNTVNMLKASGYNVRTFSEDVVTMLMVW